MLSQTPPSASFAAVGDPQRQLATSVWRSFKNFLSPCGVLLLSVNLTVVLDYHTFLADRGLAYRTIMLHSSVLSATLPPHSSPCGQTGDWTAPTHHAPSSWRISEPSYATLLRILGFGGGFYRFLISSAPQFQRKLAFLLAMASSRHPSEVVLLRCGAAFMIINADSVRFLPSRLSKTDRPGHLGPPILIRRSPGTTFLSAPSPLWNIFWDLRTLSG